ncbi:MAG: pseudouridine synthase [Erysipelotrichaceae bacterium]|nr:pseudouridine synthase [Erysipelotrichaceae bacterium]
MERLQKIIAASGICSRRKAEVLIVEGKVKVNGVVIDSLGFKASDNDKITVDGMEIKREEKVVFIFNKPKNVITSTSDDRGRASVNDYFDEDFRLFPIGRLDYDSSGLVLMSNDGKLTNEILHPRFEIPKVYEVTVDNLVSKDDINKLCKGVVIDGTYKTGRAKIKLIRKNLNKKTSFLEVTIYEGHNRQIRKMFEVFGYKVIKLHRISEANIHLGNLKPGEYRKLKPFEVLSLKKFLNDPKTS